MTDGKGSRTPPRRPSTLAEAAEEHPSYTHTHVRELYLLTRAANEGMAKGFNEDYGTGNQFTADNWADVLIDHNYPKSCVDLYVELTAPRTINRAVMESSRPHSCRILAQLIIIIGGAIGEK